MNSLRLYGERTRCWWCGKEIGLCSHKVDFTWKNEQYDVLVCSTGCETAVIGAMKYIQKVGSLFLMGVLSGLVLLAIPRFGAEVIGLLLMGLTLIVCPFCTPQTTKMIGMKKSFIVGRAIGVLTLLGGTVLFLFGLLG